MKGRVLRESEGLSAAMGLERLCLLKTDLSWGFFFFSVLAVLGLHCGGQALLPHGMWACGILVPQPGIKHISSALEGRFLTTGPPGKSCHRHLILSSGSGLQFQAMLLESG